MNAETKEILESLNSSDFRFAVESKLSEDKETVVNYLKFENLTGKTLNKTPASESQNTQTKITPACAGVNTKECV
jgi:hypothetical protein